MGPSKSNGKVTIQEISGWDGSWELIDGTPFI